MLKGSTEQIMNLPISKIVSFTNHPFSIRDDDSMKQTIESVKEYGIIVPAIVRPIENGLYELISGHRRKYACEQAGFNTMPVIVRDVDRDVATIIMVDSNLQRKFILPSERAKAYKMKIDAIKRKGARRDLTSSQVETKLRSDEIIAKESGESRAQIQRYIRLTKLNPELQQMVDNGKIGMTPAVELSYLKPDEQLLLIDTIDSEQATPSLSQAQRMKKLSQEGKLDDDSILGIMTEQKKPESGNLTLTLEKLRQYFPKSYTSKQIENTIYRLLDMWYKRRIENINQKTNNN